MWHILINRIPTDVRVIFESVRQFPFKISVLSKNNEICTAYRLKYCTTSENAPSSLTSWPTKTHIIRRDMTRIYQCSFKIMATVQCTYACMTDLKSLICVINTFYFCCCIAENGRGK